MNQPPLNRHESLRPLSRDHYAGLVQALHLKRASAGDSRDRRSAMREFVREWKETIEEHFDDEERLLNPLISEEADRRRLHDEHAVLRARAREALAMEQGDEAPGGAWLWELGTLLHDHIRWEERVLFPAIEASAGPDVLAQLEQETEVIEQTRPRWRERRRARF